LFAGGSGSNGYSNVVDIYDASAPPGQQWSTATLSQGRYDLVATTVGTKALFAGGFMSTGADNDVDIDDTSTPAGQQWSTATLSLPAGHAFFPHGSDLVAMTVGTMALFAEVNLTFGLNTMVDIYDASTGQWSTTTLRLQALDLAATTVGTMALFAG